jgi:hypothetical protein
MAKTPRKSKATRPASSVVPTIAAAAKALGRHERTLKTWFARGCPNEPGAYDLTAIAAWQDANVGSALADDTSEKSLWATEKLKAEARKATLEVEQLLGRLVEVEVPAREFAQHIVEAKTLLEQLPDRFMSFVPSLSAATKKSAKQRMQAAVREVLAGLEQALRRQADAGSS